MALSFSVVHFAKLQVFNVPARLFVYFCMCARNLAIHHNSNPKQWTKIVIIRRSWPKNFYLLLESLLWSTALKRLYRSQGLKRVSKGENPTDDNSFSTAKYFSTSIMDILKVSEPMLLPLLC